MGPPRDARSRRRDSDKDERHRGGCKTASNSVAAFDAAGKQLGMVFETASPFDRPRHLVERLAWLDEAVRCGALYPLLVIGIHRRIPGDPSLPGRQRRLSRVHRAYDKGPWLERLGVAAEWPMSGTPKRLYLRATR